MTAIKDFDAGLTFIGRIRTPWQTRDECPRNAMETEEICTIELDPQFHDGLQSIEGCSHIILLYWLDQAGRDQMLQRPPIDDKFHGVFAIRSPNRPNPIGLAVADLISVDGGTLKIRHVDCLDGTPLLDIKPYFASSDSKPDATVAWHRTRANPLPPRGTRSGSGTGS
ncbi:MAG: tRNA (N6-threonylcarbamoyladenosine(37)-N6)-methyltransferase TrmO [Fimbriimonadaceae bacterium]|nr:tRNA (N6-threonylcarbamoyladenosine(37)-N6)-methyltransferase TrmO [Alphaproteobacteria bacterium]